MARRDRSRSLRASNGSSSDLAMVPFGAAGAGDAPGGSPFTFDHEKMELALNGQKVKVHRFSDDPEMPWFQAKPILKYLGYTHITNTLEDHVYPEDKMSLQLLIEAKGEPIGAHSSTFGYSNLKAIHTNESGLYSLILRSKKSEAKKFQRWVTSEVLPAIRRHGNYGGHCHEADSVKARAPVKATARAKAPVPVKAQVRMVEDERLSFCEIVKANSGGACELKLKDLVRISYVKFVELVATEERRSVAAVCGELRDGTYGLKARLPRRWEALAVAAVGQALAPACGALPTGDADRAVFVETRSEEARGPRAFVAAGEHGIAKDAANCMWIGQLQVGQRIFFLDSWEAAVGLSLRTARALLRAGHLAENLFSANPDEAIVSQLAREGVVARQGDWATSFPSQQFGGIYLDLCCGSLTYICVQLELATCRACPGCVLGVTVTERDFNGEPLVLRALSLQEFLMNLGWRPALQGLRASTLLHRSGKGHQVLTQFWKLNCR